MLIDAPLQPCKSPRCQLYHGRVPELAVPRATTILGHIQHIHAAR
jgi:hypothetical protein